MLTHFNLLRSSRRMSSGGFSLVELLVVIAIVGVLVAILIPALSRARDRVRTVVCADGHAVTLGDKYRSSALAAQSNAGQLKLSKWSYWWY